MAQSGDPLIEQPKLFEVQPCPVCGFAGSTTMYPVNKAYAVSRSGFDVSDVPLGVAECDRCGHLFIQPVPQSRFLKAFYANYMSIAKDGFYRDRNREEIPSAFRRRYGRWLGRVGDLADEGPLLDVGSGLGTFLRLAEEYGFEVAGIEPNHEAATTLRERCGLRVHNCMLEDFENSERYAVITMWDLLEHLPDPRLALGKSRELLRPRGLLVLETPARDSFIHWLAKGAYRISGGWIKRPLFRVYGVHHLQYFSESSLRRFLADNGFEVIEVYRDQTEVEALIQRPKANGRAGQVKTLAFNTAIRGAFSLARLTGRQNKLVVFARRR
jgi:2-polyprenyl-3-methyl-5-hydroxy-6-metoxy-1,4-benzoquinol methylase